MTSLSFESWHRNIKRLERLHLQCPGRKDALLLNRMPFQEERYADYDSVSGSGSQRDVAEDVAGEEGRIK